MTTADTYDAARDRLERMLSAGLLTHTAQVQPLISQLARLPSGTEIEIETYLTNGNPRYTMDAAYQVVQSLTRQAESLLGSTVYGSAALSATRPTTAAPERPTYRPPTTRTPTPPPDVAVSLTTAESTAAPTTPEGVPVVMQATPARSVSPLLLVGAAAVVGALIWFGGRRR
jgi:hypothetical protein